MEHGSPITIEGKSTLADGLAVPRVGCNAFATAVGLVDKMVSTSHRNPLSLLIKGPGYNTQSYSSSTTRNFR